MCWGAGRLGNSWGSCAEASRTRPQSGILGDWLDAFIECWLNSREKPPPPPSHPFLSPLEWPSSLSSPGRNTEMPLSSVKCFSFHNTVLTLPVSPDPIPCFLLLPFLRPLPPSSGPWLSHISPLHSRSSLCSSSFSSYPSSSSGWSYLKLPALARLESDSSSAPAGFPECPWVAVKEFRLSGTDMGLQRKKHPLLPFCPLLLGGEGLAVLCVSLGPLVVYLTL